MKKTLTLLLLSILLLQGISTLSTHAQGTTHAIKDDYSYTDDDDSTSMQKTAFGEFMETPYAFRNSGSFSKNTSILSFGYGFGVTGNFDNSTYQLDINGLNNSSDFEKIGSFYGKYEKGIADEFGIGLYLGFADYKVKNESPVNANLYFYMSSLMLNYHFNKVIPVKNLDLYIGAGLVLKGYTFHTNYGGVWQALGGNEEIPNGYNTTKFNVAARAGIRYYLSNWFGIYGDAGYDGYSNANIGISFAFNRSNATINHFHKRKVKVVRQKNEETEDKDDE